MTLIIYSGLYKLYDQHFGAKKFAVGSSLGKKKLQNNNNETIKQYRDAKNEKNLKKIIDYDNYTTVADIHLVYSFTDVSALAQVVDVSHAPSGLAFQLHDYLRDLRVIRAHKELRTEEADASEDLHRPLYETYVVDWFREIDVPEVARALVHVARASLASGGPVDGALSGIHKASEFRLTALIDLRVHDAILLRSSFVTVLRDRHSTNFIWAQDAKLHPFHGTDLRFRIAT